MRQLPFHLPRPRSTALDWPSTLSCRRFSKRRPGLTSVASGEPLQRSQRSSAVACCNLRLWGTPRIDGVRRANVEDVRRMSYVIRPKLPVGTCRYMSEVLQFSECGHTLTARMPPCFSPWNRAAWHALGMTEIRSTVFINSDSANGGCGCDRPACGNRARWPTQPSTVSQI